jgi:hypothetical protein
MHPGYSAPPDKNCHRVYLVASIQGSLAPAHAPTDWLTTCYLYAGPLAHGGLVRMKYFRFLLLAGFCAGALYGEPTSHLQTATAKAHSEIAAPLSFNECLSWDSRVQKAVPLRVSGTVDAKPATWFDTYRLEGSLKVNDVEYTVRHALYRNEADSGGLPQYTDSTGVFDKKAQRYASGLVRFPHRSSDKEWNLFFTASKPIAESGLTQTYRTVLVGSDGQMVETHLSVSGGKLTKIRVEKICGKGFGLKALLDGQDHYPAAMSLPAEFGEFPASLPTNLPRRRKELDRRSTGLHYLLTQTSEKQSQVAKLESPFSASATGSGLAAAPATLGRVRALSD